MSSYRYSRNTEVVPKSNEHRVVNIRIELRGDGKEIVGTTRFYFHAAESALLIITFDLRDPIIFFAASKWEMRCSSLTPNLL